MKRKVIIILLTITLFIYLGTTTFADSISNNDSKTVAFNDDFTRLYYSNKTFHRIDASMLDYDFAYYEEDFEEFEYDDGVYAGSAQSESYTVIPNPKHSDIKDIYVESNLQKNIFNAYITYSDGAELTCSYLMADYLKEYEKLVNGDVDKVTIDFSWPDNNTIVVDLNKINTGTIFHIDYYTADSFEVYAQASDNSFRSVKGFIFKAGNKLYYFDFKNAGTTYDEFMFGDFNLDEKIPVKEISDEQTIALINEGLEKYYEDDMGFIYDDELASSVSGVFYFILLLLIPFVICIGSLILFIKSQKSIYKKIFAVICISAMIVILSTIIIIIAYNNNISL